MPALIGLIFAIIGILASFVPLCGACVAIPLAGVALILAIVGFATAKKNDAGTGMAMAATICSLLSVGISVGWFFYAAAEAEKMEQHNREQAAIVRDMNTQFDLDDFQWKVTEAVATPQPEAQNNKVRIHVWVKNENFMAVPVASTDFVLLADGKELLGDGDLITLQPDQAGELDVTFEVPLTAKELVLKIMGPMTATWHRQVKIEPTVALPGMPGGPGGGPGGG